MLIAKLIATSALLFAAGIARAETLVVAAPFKEYPVLAAQILDGATAALSGQWAIKPIEAGCTDAASSTVAALITQEKPDAVIGLTCIESLMPALAALGPSGTPVVTVASRADAPSKLALKNKWPLYRIGPRERDDKEAIANLIAETWREKRFAIVDDGTVFARDIAEAVRNAAEILGVKPVLVEGFEPQLENQKKLIDRLVASVATHVFIASDRANIAQIATETIGLNLTIAGPETLRAADLDCPLPAGVLMASRDKTISPEATAKINAARKSLFAFAEGYSADAYVAAEMAIAIHADKKLKTFNSAAGLMKIAVDGFAEPAIYALFQFDGAAFEKIVP